MEDIYWVLRLRLNDGQEEAFARLMPEMVDATRKEDGARSYEWHRDGDAVHIYERYASNADAGLHLQNFGASFAQRFFTVFSATGFDVYGPVTGALRDGLSAAGARFFDRAGGFER